VYALFLNSFNFVVCEDITRLEQNYNVILIQLIIQNIRRNLKMKKTIVFILTLTIIMSLVGCAQKDKVAYKENEVKTESITVAKTVETNVSMVVSEKDAKVAVDTINKFKGDASPNNVRELYNEIKEMLSPEVQDIYEKGIIAYCATATVSKSNTITSIVNVPNMKYHDKEYNGYTVKSTWDCTIGGGYKTYTANSETDVIDYDGKLLIVRDIDKEAPYDIKKDTTEVK
jgi:hypothetical protein